jgi:dihydroorotase
VEKVAHNPALLFGIVDRGFIREGSFADLVAVDLETPTHVDKNQVRYKCGWSPLEGQTLRSSVALTVLNGSVVYRDGNPMGPRVARALEFRSRA